MEPLTRLDTISCADPCIHFKKEDGNCTITNTYTDNIFGGLNMDEEGEKKKDEMGKEWVIKDIEKREYFLGMQVQQDLDLEII